MHVSQLQALLIQRLIRNDGGSQRAWRIAIGPIRLHDPATHPHCNWSVAPSGNIRQNAAIERLLDSVRLDHPIIAAG
jgi:hypothetical protein